jgi:hypothetical protein
VHVTNSSQGLLGARTTGREKSLQVVDGHEAMVEAVGTLPLLLHDGSTLYLNNVLYVPSLRINLISVASLEDDGYECLFGNNKCTIKFDDVIIGLAPHRDMLYKLSLNDFPVMNVCDVTNKRRRITTSDNETFSKLWHCRLGHISRGRMERLIKEEILALLDFSDLDHCIECIKGKYVKHIKMTGATCSSGVIEIIHTDICGPFNVKFVDGFNSFITFTDDFSRYGYIYLIHERSEALDKFKVFKSEVENQYNNKINVVCSDRGGKYYGRHTLYGQIPGPFAKFLEENDIVAQYSLPYEPQQNGVTERRSCTLMEMVCSMLSNSTLPLDLWIEALKTAAHIINCVPSKLVHKTPYELWTGRKPSINYLHI